MALHRSTSHRTALLHSSRSRSTAPLSLPSYSLPFCRPRLIFPSSCLAAPCQFSFRPTSRHAR
ncbi:hypothetical protein BC826DRAFT_1080542, partial [Russula brevipes]